MNNDSLKNRLQLADETIAILRSSNSQLDRNLSVLQSDFSVLESLLIESGQTLQRLQEMYHKEKEVSAMLSAALDKANSRNADISDLYEAERNRNKHIISDSDVECQQKVATTSFQNAAVVSHGESPSPAKFSGYSATRMHDYHLNIRDSLSSLKSVPVNSTRSMLRVGRVVRDMAESLCDELVRVEEDITALEPLLRLGQQEESDKPSPSSSSSTKQSQAAKNRARRSAGPDFVFGSPSSRLPMKNDEGLVDEEEGEEDGEGGEDDLYEVCEEEEEDYETVTPEGDDEEKLDAGASHNEDSGEVYPDSDEYLYKGDEEQEEELGSGDECDPNGAEGDVWEDRDRDGDSDEDRNWMEGGGDGEGLIDAAHD